MKKILGIVVLGLLWSSTGHTNIVKNECFGYQGYGALSGNNVQGNWQEIIDLNKKTFQYKIKGKNWVKYPVVSMSNDTVQYKDPQGVIHSYNFLTFKEEIQNSSGYLQNNCKNISSTLSAKKNQSNNTNDKIAQSKQICKDLGFKVNSEKFADCALKMMSIQFEATNKVASGSGTKQEIIVKHKQDYDIWDAMLDMSNALSGSSSNNNSSSSGSSGTRCVIQKTHAWGHTVMNCN